MRKLYLVLMMMMVNAIFINPLSGQVRIYHEPLTIPAYGVNEPEIMPDWGQYHYPYTMLYRLTNVKGHFEKAVSVLCRSLAPDELGKTKEALIQYKAAIVLYPLMEISAFRPPRSYL